MTTNKTEALARLDAIEREAEKLRRIIEAPEPVVKKPLIQEGILGVSVSFTPMVGNYGAVVKAYADAFNCMLDLRRQPGSEAAEDKKRQFVIHTDGGIGHANSIEWKLQQLCPMFDIRESTEAALEAVGKDRILRMMNTLHGRGV